jgi:hypothetical protein
MKNLTAYWVHGTPYCLGCIFAENPCLSVEEMDRAVRHDGTGHCGCCGEEFVSDELEDDQGGGEQ